MWALLNFDLCGSTGTFPSRIIPSGRGLQCSFRAVRDGSSDGHFIAMPCSAVWLPPGVCRSWWQRKGQRERCWSACSRSRLSARQTASRGRLASGRCPDRTPQPAQKNSYIYLMKRDIFSSLLVHVRKKYKKCFGCLKLVWKRVWCLQFTDFTVGYANLYSDYNYCICEPQCWWMLTFELERWELLFELLFL